MSNLPQGELCSVYSFAQGEDPIGSATPFKRCLLVELPTPWDQRCLVDVRHDQGHQEDSRDGQPAR